MHDPNAEDRTDINAHESGRFHFMSGPMIYSNSRKIECLGRDLLVVCSLQGSHDQQGTPSKAAGKAARTAEAPAMEG